MSHISPMTHYNRSIRPSRHAKAPHNPAPKPSKPAWAPQPCGLTRKELSQIVIDILG